ncbi:hypothetical protein [Leptobacterium sp. I13]|uniref:hypothetical protein n=1 Tax=Leptobacterium meishanense TaxID=3128904 RepID=UPI0030EDB0CB
MEPKKVAEYAIKYLNFQKENIKNLENSISISYEDLTDNTDAISNRIIKFMPELVDIKFKKKFSAHNYWNEKMKITNLNHENINRLSEEQMNAINTVFKKDEKTLSYFGYKLIL